MFGGEGMNETLYSIADSWTRTESPLFPGGELKSWLRERNENLVVDIEKNRLSDSGDWFYDPRTGTIHNRNNSFFSVSGFRKTMPDGSVVCQPILLQPEIGFLGIICREFQGVMHFLMHAKCEPGNVNQIQLSPTIQATKSNFTQKHGGAKPPYLHYFQHASDYEIVVDQLQSEQSSRFYKKRNRNILIRVEEEIPVLPSHHWMTLGQIKDLMREDNLVNMDTRTVLSCIPFGALRMTPEQEGALSQRFTDRALFASLFHEEEPAAPSALWHSINDQKMAEDEQPELLPLEALPGWDMTDETISCREPYPFRVVFCSISMEGREVRHWTQPLFEAMGVATFGLICCEAQGRLEFLVKLIPEPGCFDTLELGPSFQREAIPIGGSVREDPVTEFFLSRLASGEGILFDHLLSEEGGRFYHEQNRNVLLRVGAQDLPKLPEGYFLMDYQTLSGLNQFNNILNIQLRNLLSLLEA